MSKKAEKKDASKKAEESENEAPQKPTKAPVEESKTEAKPTEIEKALKPEKKKKREKGVYAMYKIDNEKVLRLRPICERCGPGYFMADHRNRYTCGHCGFTRYKPAKE